ncbi:MAG: hypothetical protein CMM25_08420, partial [Rhodospirillaceae bacterium]|nr:hypothetical protein [Rhodospirillaceae bacterium]
MRKQAFSLLLVIILCQPSLQLMANNIVKEDGTIIYEQEFFNPYRPSSVRDMLDIVPGAAPALKDNSFNQQNRRGLRSQTTQILINGKRLTTKGNAVIDYFERLPATSVKRIEIITGNTREIDADVGARIINVVLIKESKLTGTWSVGNVSFTDNQQVPTISGSINGEKNKIRYSLSLESRPRQLPRTQINQVFDANFKQTEQRDQKRRMKSRRTVVRARAEYTFSDNHTAQINASVANRPITSRKDTELFFNIDMQGQKINNGGSITNLSADNLDYEITGDYSVTIDPTLKFKGLFVYSSELADENNQQSLFVNDISESFLSTADDKDETQKEKIIRGTLDWSLNPKHNLEIGLEGAVNSLDKKQRYFDYINNQPSLRDVFNADQIITEDRAEIFASHTWSLTKKWEVETGVASEFSKLNQIGSDVNTVRKFNFIKPNIDLYYKPMAQTQFFASVTRDIGQLNFSDFISSLDRDDSEIDSGNPTLVPEKSWDFEFGTEHKLKDQGGAINIRLFYRLVTDVND